MAEESEQLLRPARERMLATRGLRGRMLHALEGLVHHMQNRQPEMEEVLLQKLKSVGKATMGEVRRGREECCKVEQSIDEYSSKAALARQYADKLAENIEQEALKACSYTAAELTEYTAIVEEMEAYSTDYLTEEHLTAFIGTQAAPPPSVPMALEGSSTLSSGITAACADTYITDHLYLGLQDGKLLRILVSSCRVDKALPSHHYAVLLIALETIKGQPCLVSSSRDKTLRVLNLQTEEVLFCFDQHPGCVVGTAVVADMLYAASLDGNVNAWNLRRGKPEGSVLSIKGLAKTIFLEDEIIVGTKTGVCHRCAFDFSSRKAGAMQTWEAHTSAVSSMLYHEEGFLITGGVDCKIHVWDMKGGAVNHVYDLSRHVDTVNDMVCYKTVLFSAGSDALIVIWDLLTGNMIRELRDHYHHVTSLSFLGRPPCRETLSKLLDTIPEEMFEKKEAGGTGKRFTPPTGCRYTPDAGCSRGTLYDDVSQWDVPSAAQEAPYVKEAESEGEVPITVVDSTQPEHCLVSASMDSNVMVWSLLP